MSDARDVVVVVGSLRKESWSRKVARALVELAPPTMKLEILEIGQLPLYNQDLDPNDPPAPWVAFRQRVKASRAVIFVTPEYNRGVPGVLKNAIDVGSRPKESAAWRGKPAAVVSCSPGPYGAFGANHHLRQSLVFLDMPALQQPEAYLAAVDKAFDAQGKLVKEDTRALLGKLLAAFDTFVAANDRG